MKNFQKNYSFYKLPIKCIIIKSLQKKETHIGVKVNRSKLKTDFLMGIIKNITLF